jgi:hypothetical protein
MPLEATMIVLDNSEYMRNGDYQPTRFGALADAVTTVFQTKIDSNPENTVGVMTMANKGCAHLIIEKKKPRSNEFSLLLYCTYQARSTSHTHKRARPDHHSRTQHLDQPRPNGVHPNRDRDSATSAEAPTEQELPTTRHRLCRLSPRGRLTRRRARPHPSRQEAQEEQRRARRGRFWRWNRGGR